MKILKPCLNESGAVLIIGLIFMAILSIMGTAAYLTTSNELMISGNYKTAKAAFYAAEAGTEEARARLSDDIGQSGTPTKEWRAFIGDADSAESIFDYDSSDSDHSLVSSLQTDLVYTVMIRHKTEADIDNDMNSDGDKDDVVLWGDSDGDYVCQENLTEGRPIEIIASQGADNRANKTITIEVRSESLFFKPPAALYVNGNLTKNGVSGNAVGAYGTCDPMPDVITTTNASTPLEASDWPAGTSTPDWLINDETDIYPVGTIITQLCANFTQMISSGNNQTFGTVSSPSGIYCSNGDWSGNGLNGYGILAINGNFTTGGNISWHGIIIVSGISTFNGGGNQSIYGAVIANSVTTINGQPDIYYDCDFIDNLDEDNSRYEACSWTDSQ